MNELRRSRRILVVGRCGAGKSTLARDLGVATGLPVIHLDQHYWTPGWVPLPDDEWDEKHDELLTRPEWIVDGSYGSLNALLSDTDYFPDGPPVCPFGTAYADADADNRVDAHSH